MNPAHIISLATVDVHGALDALSAMVDEVGDPSLTSTRATSTTRGVVVRHLMLPGTLEDSKRVVQTVWEHFGSSVLLSIIETVHSRFGRERQGG